MKKWFRKTKLYQAWSRFLSWFGDLMLATEPPLVKARHIRQALKLAQPGDILCRRYTYYMDSHFIKGEYSHSGIVIDDVSKEDNMMHAVAEGVGHIDIIDFIKDSDGFVILRPAYKNEEAKQKAINYAISKDGMPYDFLFDRKEKDSYYCHELSNSSLKEGGISIIPEEDIVYASDLRRECPEVYEADIDED